MDISQRGLDLIKDYESYSSKAYPCPEGVPTLGWGSIRWDAKTPVKMGDSCTVEQAEDLLRKEVILVEDAIDSSVKVPLTQGQFDCLCSWGYNVGAGWINGKRKGGAAALVKLLNKGRYDAVPGELVKFKRGAVSKKSYGGLLKRRKRELRELWFSEHSFTPAAKSAHPLSPAEPAAIAEPMPQAVAPEAPSAKEIATTSWTIRGALAAIGGTAVQVYEWSLSGASEAGVEAEKLKTALGPWEALFAALKANTALLAASLVLVGCAIVIARRFQERST